MSNFIIEHNPFFNETKIWIENKLTNDEKFSKLKNKRLIDVIDDIPEEFFNECNESNINITFIGRNFEYEDLLHSINNYKKEYAVNFNVVYRSKYDSINMEKLKEFESVLKNSPIKGISENKKFITRFLNKLTTEFEVAIVATMSSGKSTLINSMIGQSILPARNEATTAKIFSIRDDDDAENFSVNLLNMTGELLEASGESLEEQLENANNQDDVHEIRLNGDIPNISSSVANLVLLDTPGPNNAQNQEHKEVTYKLIKDEEKNPLIIYVLNAQQLTTDGVNDLLEEIAETINKKNNSQNHDRFIFVLNKADRLKKTEVVNMINNAKEFLEKFEIIDPKIFPISSYRALCCRKSSKGFELDDDEDDELDTCEKVVEKEREYHYFEQYAPITNQQKSIIENRLKKAKEKDDWITQAEIHSGIPTLEMAIDDYVTKYAIPMKIHDAFAEIEKSINLEVKRDEILRLLEKQKDENNNLKEKLQEVSIKIASEESIDSFKKKIQSIKISHEPIDTEKEKLEKKFNDLLKKSIFKSDIEVNKAKRELDSIFKTISSLETSIKTTLEQQIHSDIKTKTDEIVNEFKEEISKTFDEIELGDMAYSVKVFSESMLPSKEKILQGSSKEVDEGKYKTTYAVSFWGIEFWETGKEWIPNIKTKSDPKKLEREFLQLRQSFVKKMNSEMKEAEKELTNIKIVATKEIDVVREVITMEMQKMSNLIDNKENLEKEIKSHENILSWIERYNLKKENFIN